MFDLHELRRILDECTWPTAVDPEHLPDGCVVVNVHFFSLAIDKAKTEANKERLIQVLDEYPAEAWGHSIHDLKEGPSYIEVGGAVDSQDVALRLFAIGEAMGLWTVVTPERVGFEGDEARKLAGSGFVMIDGFLREERPAWLSP